MRPAAGMVGMVAAIDLRIGEAIEHAQRLPLAAYPTFLRADTQARQLQLMGLYAHTACTSGRAASSTPMTVRFPAGRAQRRRQSSMT